ncbi:ankyrin repeat family protein [Tanacetum coccineum]
MADNNENGGVCPIGGHIELMELFLSVGVDVDSQSDSGTPLVWAAGHAQQDAVKLLLKHKADPNIETGDGVNLLLCTVAAGSLPCLELLIEYVVWCFSDNVLRTVFQGTERNTKDIICLLVLWFQLKNNMRLLKRQKEKAAEAKSRAIAKVSEMEAIMKFINEAKSRNLEEAKGIEADRRNSYQRLSDRNYTDRFPTENLATEFPTYVLSVFLSEFRRIAISDQDSPTHFFRRRSVGNHFCRRISDRNGRQYRPVV